MKFIQTNLLPLSFWLVGVTSFAVRAVLNFSQELLIGNGGYYPLQVRTVLERGELAFPDMPLLFYLDAGIVRLLSFFGAPASNQMILNVVKVVDSLSIPLLLVPLYQIVKGSKRNTFSLYLLSIVAFAVLSFHTLNLTSSFQKNALAIALLVFSVAWFLKFLETKQRKHLLTAIVFFILIGLTHFGTFAFALLMGTLFLVFWFKKNAILPILLLIAAALALIYQFDPVRFSRLLFAWKGVFSRTPPPDQLLLSVVYFAVALLSFRVYRKFKGNFKPIEKALLFTFIALLVIVPSPLIEPQASSRMSAFLFVPLVLLLLLFGPLISSRSKKVVSVLLGLITLGSVCFFLSLRPPLDVSEEALVDLYKMKRTITSPDRAVVVSRHNLEFWVAWAMEVDVSHESKFNDELINEYEEIYIINQIRQEGSHFGPPGMRSSTERSPFDEPLIPANARLVYSSQHFKLYKYNKKP